MTSNTFVKCSFETCTRPRMVKGTGLCQSHQLQHRKGGPLRDLRRFQGFGEVPTCSHEGCNSAARTRGYCVSHYHKLRRTGTTYGPGSAKSCSYPDCPNPVSSRGMCETHYVVPSERSIPCHIPGCTRAGQYGFCTTHTTRARRFGLSPRELESLVKRGKCDACGEPGFNHAIHHDHGCCPQPGRSCGGCVVAYLCKPCNSAAGLVGDRAETLIAIARILENNKPAFPGKEKTGSWRN